MRKASAIETEEGDGAIVKRLFPTEKIRYYDPFVLLDEFFVKPSTGFPPHEHKGFEAITYMLDGSFKHKDNIGNDIEIFPGGAQLFTAGKGIVHSEMPGKSKMNHGLQLWINLPRKKKGVEPSYQKEEKLPTFKKDYAEIIIIIGERSKLKLNTKVIYKDIKLRGKINIKVDRGFNGFLYVLKGKIKAGNTEAAATEAIFFNEDIVVESKNSRFVYVSGKPHNEPIHQNGPFVD